MSDGGARLARRALLFGLALALCVVTCLHPGHASADWDAQLSSRLLIGGGAFVAEQSPDPWPLFEAGLRADLLIGENRPSTVRFGPALDLRTEDFRTLELGGGLAVLFPTGLGFGITTTFGAGWGARPEDRDGAFAFGQLAFGYRPYNYFSPYAYGVSVYGATRIQLESDPRAWEITIGIEVDLEFIFAVPFMLLWELANAHDPDEPPPPG